MDLDFVILADEVTTRDDGKLNIEGAGFDTIWAPEVPARHPRFVLAVRVLLSRHETAHHHWLEVLIQEADGELLAHGRADLQPLPTALRRRIAAGTQFGVGMVLHFDDVVFPTHGHHQIIVQWDGNEARSPLRLSVLPPPPPVQS